MIRVTIFSKLLCLMLAAAWGAAPCAAYSAEPRRHALLIGCSKYPGTDAIVTLHGAENDVTGFERLLQSQFGFQDVVKLTGWPDDEARRPTYENICAAFEALIAKVADAGQEPTQVVILLSGHGLQVPVPASQQDLLDPANPEGDGLDEAFVPADYRPGGRLLRDNQIGGWLDRLQAHGAHVWVVFDSCHSGTMSRGDEEISRGLDPAALGLSPEDYRRAASGARDAKTERHAGLDYPDAARRGSLVAFYAAQDFERAPEVIRPAGAQRLPENRHGLLSYHLEQLLTQQERPRTYRELGRVMVGRYRAERGRTAPTPFFEGALDRDVLGLQEWPRAQPLVLHKDGAEVRLTAGELAGVSPGTILAVRAASAKEQTPPLGHVRAVRVTPIAAEVESVAFGDAPAADLASFPDGAHCTVVSQELNDAPLKIAVVDTGAHTNALQQLLPALQAASKNSGSVVQLVENVADAGWTVVLVDPAQAQRDYGAQVDGPAMMLVEAAPQEAPASQVEPPRREAIAAYPLSDVADGVARLQGDLRKIYAWRCMWRIAQTYGAGPAAQDEPTLSLEVARLRNPADTSRGVALGAHRLHAGDCITARCVNTGVDPLWYSVFFLDGRFGVTHVHSGSIRGLQLGEERTEEQVDRMQVNAQTAGVEGYVVIAVSQRQQKLQPDYRFLEQSSVGDAKQPRRAAANPRDTFSRLLLNAVQSGRPVRSALTSEQPQVAAWSWLTVATDEARGP